MHFNESIKLPNLLLLYFICGISSLPTVQLFSDHFCLYISSTSCHNFESKECPWLIGTQHNPLQTRGNCYCGMSRTSNCCYLQCLFKLGFRSVSYICNTQTLWVYWTLKLDFCSFCHGNSLCKHLASKSIFLFALRYFVTCAKVCSLSSAQHMDINMTLIRESGI